MKEINENDYVESRDHISMTPGEMLAALRKLQMLTQEELADKARMTQANISSMESGRQQIGRDRAMALARVLNVHPAIIMFPDFEMEESIAPQCSLSNANTIVDSGNSPLRTWRPSSLSANDRAVLDANIVISMKRMRKAEASLEWRDR